MRAAESKEGQVASFCGSYDQAELKSLLNCLSNAFYNIPITMVISCGKHAINLSLDPITNEWLLIDPNHLPIELFLSYNSNSMAKLAESLDRSLFGESRTIFSATIYADAQYKSRIREKMSVLRKSNPTWKKLHAVTDEKLNEVNKYQISWLYIACQEGHKEIVELLLGNKQLDINKARESGATPFYIACQEGHKEIVELLLGNKKLEPNKAKLSGTTPFYIACQEGHKEIVELLLDKVDISMPNKNGTTPFYIACEYGHKVIVELLLDKVDINKARESGATPFYIACQEGHKEIVELLLGNEKLDIDKARKSGATAFYIACQKGHTEIARMLIKKGININAVGITGHTPLQVACLTTANNNNEELFELLLKNGASLDHKNDASQTALEIAKEKKNTAAIKVISKFLKNKKSLYNAPSSTPKLLAESWQKDILLQSNVSSNQVVLHKTVVLTY